MSILSENHVDFRSIYSTVEFVGDLAVTLGYYMSRKIQNEWEFGCMSE